MHRTSLCFILGLFCMGAAAPLATGPRPADAQAFRLHTRYGSFDAATLSRLAAATPVDPQARSPRYLVLSAPVSRTLRQVLADRGVHVSGYIPDHTLLVLANAADVQFLRGLPQVQAVVDEPAAFRIHPKLLQATLGGLQPVGGPRAAIAAVPIATAADQAPSVELWLELHPGADRLSLQALIAQLGGQLQAADEGSLWRLALPPAQVGALAAHPAVAYIEAAQTARVQNDASYGPLQASAPHQSPIWDQGLHGEGQIAALCDVGINAHTCFFSGDKVVAYQQISSNTAHDLGHGTHVAGSMVGDRGNNGTYDSDDGMAPAARLVVQDTGDAAEGVLRLPANFGGMLAQAFDAGARVHVNSWGTPGNAYTLLDRALDDFVATHPEMLVVVAQGNAGEAAGSVGSPASAKNVIAVGAYDAQYLETLATFSAHGPTADGRIKPTLTAPGVQIVSADAGSACGFTVKSGTSMAAPMVGGAALLVRQYYTEGYYPSGRATAAAALQPSAALLKATLMAGADSMNGQNTGGPAPANGQGFGRVDLQHALPFAGGPTALQVVDAQQGLQPGESFTAHITLTRAGPLRVALSWMDAAAQVSAAKQLVNDLDLELTDPQGHTFVGNHLAAGASLPLGAGEAAADHTNVEEIIALPSAAAGVYSLRIVGSNVPMGPQTFAVAAVGPLDNTAPAQVQLSGAPSGLTASGSMCPGCAVSCVAGACAPSNFVTSGVHRGCSSVEPSLFVCLGSALAVLHGLQRRLNRRRKGLLHGGL